LNLASERLTAEILACLNRRDGRAAEPVARRLVQTEPRNDRARFLLTNALCLQGRLVEALDTIGGALAIRPHEPDYLTGKAQILGRLGWSSQAIEWYRQALASRPSQVLAAEYAQALLSEGYVDETIRLLEPIAEGAASGCHLMLGQAYTENRQFDDAETSWRRSLESGADPRSVVITQVGAEINAGRLEVAESLIQDALGKYSDLPQLYGRWAALKRIEQSDGPMVERIEGVWRRNDIALEVRSELGYALGKAHHDLGDYQRAMEFYDAANLAAYQSSSIVRHFDTNAWRSYIELQIRTFTEEKMAEWARQGVDDDAPCFVVGMIRSGTTLVEHILSSHSQIGAGGESTFWADYRNEILDPLSGKFDAYAAGKRGAEFLKRLRSKAPNTRYVTEKNPLNLILCGMLHCIYPRAKFVHVDRHPVDNALSIWMTPLKTGLPFVYDRKNIVAAFRECRRFARHCESVLPQDRFRSFSYEAITSSPVDTIGDMLQFLELEAEPQCFHPERNQRAVRTPSVWQVRQPLHTGSQAKWKHYEPWLGEFAELFEE
jgi:tetratricopeptide (TPR) repeat protein